MKKNDIISYTQDFISLLFQNLDSKLVRSIVLFGSASRGDFDQESDIDLFIDLFDERKKKSVEKKVEEVKFDFECIKEKKWKLRNIDFEVVCTVGSLVSDEWKPLRRSIESSGIVLYGKFNQESKNGSLKKMIKYDLNRLKQNEKMTVIRHLFGYEKKIGKKTYKKDGLVKEFGGRKIKNGVFLIPNQRTKDILDYLNKKKVKFEIQEIWSEE